jgi:hypothetical protein
MVRVGKADAVPNHPDRPLNVAAHFREKEKLEIRIFQSKLFGRRKFQDMVIKVIG